MNKNWTPITLATTAILMTGYLYFRDTPIDATAPTTGSAPIVHSTAAKPSTTDNTGHKRNHGLDERLISQATSTLTRSKEY